MAIFRREYILKDGGNLIIRNPEPGDAAAVIAMVQQVYTETQFLGREPGEFNIEEERERQLIADWKASETVFFNIAEVDGAIVGSCHASISNSRLRYRHRVTLSISILMDYWRLGIGKRMMEAAIEWAEKLDGVTQIELDVDTMNERAIAMYQSVGFKIVGTHPRDRRMVDGSYRDEYHMAIYFDEYIGPKI